MPLPSLQSLASKAGKSLADAERYYSDAKAQRMKELGKGEDDLDATDYQFIMGVVKNRLGISESIDTESDFKVRSFFDSGILNFSTIDDVYIDPSEDYRVKDISWLVNEHDWPVGHEVIDIVNNYEGSIQNLHKRVLEILKIPELTELVSPIKPRRRTLAQKQGSRKASRTKFRRTNLR